MLRAASRLFTYIRKPGATQNAIIAAVLLAFAVSFLTLDHLSPKREQNQILGALRNAVFDTYQQLWPRQTSWDTVRIIDIDEKSLADPALGQWPWSRDKIARIVDNLTAAQAGVIGFDIVFAEPDRISPQACIVMGEAGGEDELLAQVFSKLPSNEDILAESIRKSGRVVLGVAPTNGAKTREDAVQVHGPLMQGGDPAPVLYRENLAFRGAIHNLPELEEEALRVGSFASHVSQDGTIRNLPIVAWAGGQIYPTLGFAMWSARFALIDPSFGTYRIVTRTDEDGNPTGIAGYVPTSPALFNAVGVDTYLLDSDQSGQVQLHFAEIGGEEDPHKGYEKLYISASDLYHGNFRPEQIAGRFVIIGASAQALHDIRNTPVEGLRPGMEVHAQFIDSMFHELLDAGGNFLSERPRAFLSRGEQSLIFEILALLISGVALVVMVPRMGPFYNLLLIWVLVGGFLGFSIYKFRTDLELIDPSFFTIATMTMFTGLLYGNWRAEQSQKKFIRDAFSQYLSPNLVETLAARPDMLKLGGEFKEISMIFTDIASFTTFTEKTDPEIAVKALNDYLTGMLDIVMEMGGTIDKIIGDAVVVLFNAPIDQKDHHQRAIRCALAMDQFAEAFKAQVNAAGVTLFGHTRIGVNCGRVLVGNFGGDKHFDYTCHGDAMNTAARLESLNKHLGTRICVSKAIAEYATDLKMEPIGTLVLKGKSEGIEVFRPLSDGDYASKASTAYRDAFAQMDECPREDLLATWEDLHQQHPHHPLITLHHTRYQNGESGTRMVMTEK